jgi:hypothetical protein
MACLPVLGSTVALLQQLAPCLLSLDTTHLFHPLRFSLRRLNIQTILFACITLAQGSPRRLRADRVRPPPSRTVLGQQRPSTTHGASQSTAAKVLSSWYVSICIWSCALSAARVSASLLVNTMLRCVSPPTMYACIAGRSRQPHNSHY